MPDASEPILIPRYFTTPLSPIEEVALVRRNGIKVRWRTAEEIARVKAAQRRAATAWPRGS